MMPSLASLLFLFSSLLLIVTVDSSCSTCIDYTRVPETNGASLVETTIRLIQHSGIFPNDYGALQRIAWLETRYGENQLTYRPDHDGGIWNINQTKFSAIQIGSQHKAMIQSEFCFNWDDVQSNDLRKPLYSALAARLLIHQISNGSAVSQDSSAQAQMWLSIYTNIDRTQNSYEQAALQHNSTSNKVTISNINIDTITAFSLCTNESVYFSYNISTDVPLIKISLVTNGSASLYISNAGPPSESFHCAQIEETSSTGYVYVSLDQLSSCGSEEVLFISVVGREEYGMTAASLILSNANDSYEFIQDIGSDSDWFAVGMYSNHPDVGSIPISVFVTSDSDTAFNISIESYEGIILSGEVKPYETSEFLVPETYMVSNESDYMNGLIVRADDGNKMRVSVSNHYFISSDSYLALPLIEYQGVTEYTYFAVTPNFTSPNLTSRVLIVCGFNDTSITITSTQNASMYLPSGAVMLEASSPMTISGNIYQTILIESEDQLMGTKVVTDKPVTFLSGHQCASLPDNISCDFAIEQIPPTINWGRNFIFPLLSSRVGGSFLSILASESDTTVEVNCTNSNSTRTLSESFTISSEGDYATMLVAPDDALCSVTSSKPTLLTVLSTSNNYDTTEGDPLMVLVQPIEQYLNANHSFTAFKSDIDNHYVNLMVNASADNLNDILLDDEAVDSSWKSINTFGGARAGYTTQLNVANTTHSVSVRARSHSSAGDIRIGGMMYGFACSVGYGQLIATNLYLIHETTNRLSATVTMPPRQHKVGDNVKLTCNSSGLPLYALHWMRGGSRVYPSCKYSISSSSPGSSVLTIYNASETDSGMYECIAHSYYSDPVTATSQALSLVRPSTDNYSIPTITPRAMSSWTLINTSHTLSFNISNAVPPVTSNHLWWRFSPFEGEGRYLDPNTNSKYIFGSDHLHIEVNEAKLTDSGKYTLIVKNEAGLANSTITFNVYIAPRINTSLPRNVDTNGSVTFNCTADGYPRPSIRWTKGDVALSDSNPRITISSMDINSTSERQQTMSSLTITGLTEADSGAYLCRASSLEVPQEAVLMTPFHLTVTIIMTTDYCDSNPCQHDGTCFSKQSTFNCICIEEYTGNECQDKLIVYKPPEFTETPQGIAGAYYSAVNLTCKATGSPTPTIYWYKDGDPLSNNNDDSSVLKIPELGLDKRGYYHCVAKVVHNGNNVTINSQSVLVNIKDIVQYEAIIAAPVNTSSQDVEQQVRNSLHNDNFMGNTEVLLVKAKPQNSRRKRSVTDHDIIITLRTDEGPSESLRKSLEDQINAAGSGISLLQQIDRFDGCKSDVTIIPPHTNRTNINVTIEWKESNLGEDVQVSCPCGDVEDKTSSLMATRSCRGDFTNGGVWEKPFVAPCNFSDFAREICELTMLEVPDRVDGLNNLTSDKSFNLDSTDVAVVTLVLLTTTKEVAGDEMLSRSYLQVVDNIIAIEPAVLVESQSVSKTSTRILNTIDLILSELPVTEINEPVIITFERLAASTIKLNVSNFEGLVFSSDVNSSNIGEPQYGPNNNATTDETISIILPEDLLDDANTTDTIKVINKVFIDDILFLRRDNKSLEVNSAIASAAVVDTPIQGLENSINISFPMGKGNISKQSCAFWNFSLDDEYGDWSPEGCTLVVVDNKRICLCNHLTNFALLLDVSKKDDIPEDEGPIPLFLEAVTYIGIIISVVCILLTLFTYIVAKKLRKRSSGQLIINLCLALLFLYLSFILAVHSRKNEVLCAASALILQYFFLVTFLAMGCESVILYRELVIIVGERKHGVALKAALVCWILPLLVVGFCFAPNYNHYVHRAFCRAFDIPFYIGTVAPFILIYIFNSIVFTIIIISLLKRGQSSATKLPGHVYVKQQLGVAISLSVLFGITWGLGLFASNTIYRGDTKHVRDAFAALFVILTTFHGLGLFVMHCVRPAKVREEVKSIFFEKKRTTRTSATGGIHKDRMTAASKNAGYTTVTIDKRSSYSATMYPVGSLRDSTASLKKNGDDSLAIGNSFATHKEETEFTANPDFVNVESSPEMTPVKKKFQDEKFETKEDSNSSTGSYASNDNHPIVSSNGTPAEP